MSAARAYKDITDGLEAGADELRERERERAVTLAVELVTHHRNITMGDSLANATRAGFELCWEDVLDALWTESWLTLRPKPGPDRDTAPVADVAELVAEVAALAAAMEARAAELYAAVLRRGFGLPARR